MGRSAAREEDGAVPPPSLPCRDPRCCRGQLPRELWLARSVWNKVVCKGFPGNSYSSKFFLAVEIPNSGPRNFREGRTGAGLEICSLTRPEHITNSNNGNQVCKYQISNLGQFIHLNIFTTSFELVIKSPTQHISFEFPFCFCKTKHILIFTTAYNKPKQWKSGS
jgi:hypothetical protein